MRAIPILLTAGLFAFGATVVTAGPAQAANFGCNTTASDVDHGAYRTGTTGNGARMYNGPHSTCGQVDYIYPWEVLDYYCYTRNDAGNDWTLLRSTTSPNSVGWIYDGNLADGGSKVMCPGGNP